MWRCHSVGDQDTERGIGGGGGSVSRAASVTEELLAGLGCLTAVYFWGAWGSACYDVFSACGGVCVFCPRGFVLVSIPKEREFEFGLLRRSCIF